MDWIKKLKIIMNDQGVNIEQLKSKIEQNGNSLSRNSIGNILNGRNSPKIDTLQVIADALGLELYDLFSVSGTESDTSVDGFVEYKGEIHRIKAKKDLKRLLLNMGEIEETEPEPKLKKDNNENPQSTFNETLVRTYIPRNSVKSNNPKLTRHIFRRYNVTICDKKEFFEIPNELKRDVKIWVFKSKEDSVKAKTDLKRNFNFQFNE